MRKGTHHTLESRLKASRSGRAYWAGVEGRVRALVASEGPMRDLLVLLRDLERPEVTAPVGPPVAKSE